MPIFYPPLGSYFYLCRTIALSGKRRDWMRSSSVRKV
jgi:hypothetical protein